MRTPGRTGSTAELELRNWTKPVSAHEPAKVALRLAVCRRGGREVRIECRDYEDVGVNSASVAETVWIKELVTLCGEKRGPNQK